MFVLNGNADRILQTLKSCGLTEYESKVYFTLLLTERSKIGELSRKSSVPQPKIYLTVESLKEKGLVYVVDEFPKVVSPEPLAPYLSRKINEKQKEILNLIVRKLHQRHNPQSQTCRDKIQKQVPRLRAKAQTAV